MKRSLLFIEPTAAQLNIFTQFTLPRLGSFILAGLANRRPAWIRRFASASSWNIIYRPLKPTPCAEWRSPRLVR